MECTQRLECTQELNCTQSEKVIPEQIGFLGICGKTYPVKKGPNKIGRDPQACNIILNFNSVSRQHAVINILNKKDFMLMDLDSANKTKLSGEALQPYIPKPLQNGDVVAFGEVFGIFRLLEEEEDDLPMTQVLDIPDTPLPVRQVSKLNMGTTVPESPEVSDKEDSFIVPSQPKTSLQSPKMRKLIKSGKTISIQPIGSSKIDNIFWSSSKKSTSINLDDSTASLNDSIPAVNQNNKENKVVNIHELETQIPPGRKELNISKDSIYTANTQVPESVVEPSIYTANTQLPTGDIYSANTQLPELCDVGSIHNANTQLPNATSSPSIHTMNTQLPPGSSPSIHTISTQLPPAFGSPSIHNIDTQLPNENLPRVCKINEQEDVQFDLCARKHDDSLFNTKMCNEKDIANNRSKSCSPASVKSSKLNKSNEELLFDDIDQPYEDMQESQAILTEDIALPINRCIESEPDFAIFSQIPVPKSAKRNMRIGSDSSADCDDIDLLPTQKLTVKKVVDDDTTDCEEDDNMIDLKIDKTTVIKEIDIDIVDGNKDLHPRIGSNNDVDFEDMPTQILQQVDSIEKDAVTKNTKPDIDIDFEDLPTQVLAEDLPLEKELPNHSVTKIIKIENNSPFKIPSNSSFKAKRISKTPKIKPMKYYQNTQEVIDDLSTQQNECLGDKDTINVVEKQSDKYVLDTSLDLDPKETPDDFVKNMTSKEVLDVIGVDEQVVPVTKVPSDGSTASDVENTPKKSRLFNFNTILPDSQEIKTERTLTTTSIHTLSSSDSETEINSEEPNTPIVFRRKTKSKPDIKLDLSSKFDVETLPSRIITRVRKPTQILQNAQNKNMAENILKPKFLTEQEEMNANTIDIIQWNISNLKTTSNKKNNQSKIEIKHTDVDVGIAESVKRTRSSKKKTEDAVEVKVETKPQKPKESKEETKSKEIRKRKSKDTKKEQEECKNQSSLSTNRSFAIFERKESNIANISKESEESIKSSTGTKRTRSTRNAKTNKTDEKHASPDRESHTEKPKRKYTRKETKDGKKQEKVKAEIKTEEATKSSEPEIRRSRRKRTVKGHLKEEPDPKLTKSILKNNSNVLEESAVYNMPSSSGSDTSRSKRLNLDDSEAPCPKRTRSVANYGRITPAVKVKPQFVLFTALRPVQNENWKTKLENMGATVVTDLMKSTMVLTMQIKRTFKLLCAVGLGKPIVGPGWVDACDASNTIVDPWLHLIKDTEAESRFHFSLEQTLRGKRNFLKGYNVSSTPNVMPAANEMKLIVECSGGTWKESGPRWICISTKADSALWPSLRQRGATIVSPEFILGGVLRQRVDIEVNTFK